MPVRTSPPGGCAATTIIERASRGSEAGTQYSMNPDGCRNDGIEALRDAQLRSHLFVSDPVFKAIPHNAARADSEKI